MDSVLKGVFGEVKITNMYQMIDKESGTKTQHADLVYEGGKLKVVIDSACTPLPKRDDRGFVTIQSFPDEATSRFKKPISGFFNFRMLKFDVNSKK